MFPAAVPDVGVPLCPAEALSDGRVTLAEQLLRHRAKLPQAALLFVHFLLEVLQRETHTSSILTVQSSTTAI